MFVSVQRFALIRGFGALSFRQLAGSEERINDAACAIVTGVRIGAAGRCLADKSLERGTGGGIRHRPRGTNRTASVARVLGRGPRAQASNRERLSARDEAPVERFPSSVRFVRSSLFHFHVFSEPVRHGVPVSGRMSFEPRILRVVAGICVEKVVTGLRQDDDRDITGAFRA